jgi:tRNA(Ile)-lysidine synthase
MDLVRYIDRHLKDEQLLRPEDSIVAAVSGGPDSVAMLHILFLLSREWKWRLVVAHVNHGFRIEESEREAEFVQALASSMGLPCEVAEIDVPAYAKEEGLNSQAAARQLRYDFLLETASRQGCRAIVTAHHADDQTETVVMRFLRGAGLGGLAGISPVRPLKKMELIRPFLRITKQELLTYCEENGLAYCEDSSNRKRDYVRNRIRLDLIPALTAYNPRLTETIGRMAETLRGEDDFLEREAREAFDRLVTAVEGGCLFSSADFTGVHVALQRRIVKLILNYLFSDPENADFTAVEQVREAALRHSGGTTTLHLGENIALVREYDQVKLIRCGSDEGGDFAGFDYSWDPESTFVLDVPEAGVRFDCVWGTAAEAAPNGDAACLLIDADLVVFPLHVRNRRAGDRMRIVGLNGRKKVKDIFIDDKIPPSLRERLPILTDGAGTVLWIPGIRRSAAAAVTPSSRRTLCIRRMSTDNGLEQTQETEAY